MNFVVTDDHYLIRKGISILIDENFANANITLCSSIEDLFLVMDKCIKTPDLLVLDIFVNADNGIDVLPKLLKKHPNLKILVISALSEEYYSYLSIKAGAYGFISKKAFGEKLVEAIKLILAGEKYLSSEHSLKFYERSCGAYCHSHLTLRESQVMIALAQGKSNKEISSSLFISPKTVSTYKTRICKKMGFNSVTDISKYCIENKLVS